jgi:hypothetical protein
MNAFVSLEGEGSAAAFLSPSRNNSKNEKQERPALSVCFESARNKPSPSLSLK